MARFHLSARGSVHDPQAVFSKVVQLSGRGSDATKKSLSKSELVGKALSSVPDSQRLRAWAYNLTVAYFISNDVKLWNDYPAKVKDGISAELIAVADEFSKAILAEKITAHSREFNERARQIQRQILPIREKWGIR